MPERRINPEDYMNPEQEDPRGPPHLIKEEPRGFDPRSPENKIDFRSDPRGDPRGNSRHNLRGDQRGDFRGNPRGPPNIDYRENSNENSRDPVRGHPGEEVSHQ